MKMLIIDTSQQIGTLALYREGFGFEKKEFDSGHQQKILIPLVDSLLHQFQTPLSDLTSIATCIGPGSFTGTRIGVMTAKTFSYALNIPLIPFNSLLPFHTPGTLTIKETKDDLCFVFDGTSLEKIPISSLNPSLPHINILHAKYSLNPILDLSPKTDYTLIY